MTRTPSRHVLPGRLVAWVSVFLVACNGKLAITPGPDAGSGSRLDGSQDPRDAPSRSEAIGDTFRCDLPAATPALGTELYYHPREPYAGQTVTLVLASDTMDRGAAPRLSGTIVNAAGTRTVSEQRIIGGGATLYMSFADLRPGENCIALRHGDTVEASVRVVTRTPGVPRGNGVWRVTRNHQWTCEETNTYGNQLWVDVEDENGNPVEGITVRMQPTDDTVFPVPPDYAAADWASWSHPKTLTTDSHGHAELWTPWGEGIRTPIDGKPSYFVYNLWVEDGASDVATEITTGIWETDDSGCNFCGEHAKNVYGHWRYAVTFRRDPTAAEVCDVPSDHAGQSRCEPMHFMHDPAQRSCWPVAP